MARYIDADEFLRNMKDLYQFAGFEDNEIHFSLLDIQCNVEGEPTADVVERKEGRWIFDNSYAYIERYICSSCRESYKVDTFMGKPMWNYCPNCGAEMSGGESNE